MYFYQFTFKLVNMNGTRNTQLHEMLALAEINANLNGAMGPEEYDVFLYHQEMVARERAADEAEAAWIARREAENWYTMAA